MGWDVIGGLGLGAYKSKAPAPVHVSWDTERIFLHLRNSPFALTQFALRFGKTD